MAPTDTDAIRDPDGARGAFRHRDGATSAPRSRRPRRGAFMIALANALNLLKRRAPRLEPLLRKWFVERGVPLNRAIGLRVDHVASDSSRVALRLPARRGNLNVGGTVHGAAIIALAESVHGVAVLWQFSPSDHVMVARELSVEFLAPGRGALFVEFALDASVRRSIGAELARNGRCDVRLASEVTDGGGKTVARLVGSYVIRRRRGEAR
jgi:acyl-coenzyme A thioesterase PaaI-like protein